MPTIPVSAETQLTPAEYLYGDSLQAQHEANRMSTSPDSPYPYGRLLAESALKGAEYEKIILKHREGVLPDPSKSFDILSEDMPNKVHRNPWLESVEWGINAARADLADRGFDKLAELDNEALKAELITNHHKFVETVQKRRPELVKAMESFVARMHQAIDQQGLPLTHEQLEQRLSGVAIGFRNRLNDKNNSGDFNPAANEIEVPTDVAEDDIEHIIYHELLHAISGSRQVVDNDEIIGMESRRVGLDQPNKSRLWLNEATTDLLANLLLDPNGHEWDLGSLTRSLIHSGSSTIYGVLGKLPDSRKSGYIDYKLAVLRVTQHIPTGVLLRAYFAQDHDSLETDQHAGAHAERDLQRAIKVAGGKSRIAKLRVIDQAFQTGNNKTGLKQARKIERWDRSELGRAGRVINRRKVTKHTHDYQERIKRAKTYVASRGQI